MKNWWVEEERGAGERKEKRKGEKKKNEKAKKEEAQANLYGNRKRLPAERTRCELVWLKVCA